MTPSSRRVVPPLFPTYRPDPDSPPSLDDIARYITRWGKRVLLMCALGGAAATVAARMGVQGPHTLDRLKAVEDSVAATSHRVTTLEELVRGNLYISCQTLGLVQPARAVPPEQCKP